MRPCTYPRVNAQITCAISHFHPHTYQPQRPLHYTLAAITHYYASANALVVPKSRQSVLHGSYHSRPRSWLPRATPARQERFQPHFPQRTCQAVCLTLVYSSRSLTVDQRALLKFQELNVGTMPVCIQRLHNALLLQWSSSVICMQHEIGRAHV